MKAQLSSAALVVAAGMAVLVAATAQGEVPAAEASAKGAPAIDQMVVFRSGAVLTGRVRAERATTKVGRRSCRVAAATPLAALLRSRPGKIAFHDYGDCSRRPADSAGLFVRAMRGERNRAQDGWVYKVGRKLATAGAADPAGPFGNGRLRAGDDVVWFYCRQRGSGTCQRSLAVAIAVDGRRATVTVRGYDDAGDGIAIEGAKVHVARLAAAKAAQTLTTGADGRATLTLKRGRHAVHATKKGAIRSFARRVTIE